MGQLRAQGPLSATVHDRREAGRQRDPAFFNAGVSIGETECARSRFELDAVARVELR